MEKLGGICSYDLLPVHDYDSLLKSIISMKLSDSPDSDYESWIKKSVNLLPVHDDDSLLKSIVSMKLSDSTELDYESWIKKWVQCSWTVFRL